MYGSLNIVKAIKSKRLGWAVHAGRMKEVRSVFKILTDTPTGKRIPGVDGRTILEWILMR